MEKQMQKTLAAPRLKSQAAFSLVELMVVVAIIGILAALAVPRFKVFQAKARQAEAKTVLANIYTLQQTYYGDNDKYAEIAAGDGIGMGSNCGDDAKNDLGFKLDNCAQSRYKYTITIDQASGGFTATATSGSAASNKVMQGCNPDVWQIDDKKCICAVNDVTSGSGCKGQSPNTCATKCPK